MKLTLIGFMGSGKTTMANELSNQLNCLTNDLDQMIVNETGMSIPEYFNKNGEASFRQLEHNLLQTALKQDGILSTGGGTPMQQANFDLIKKQAHPTIFLNAEDETIEHHLINDGIEERPLFKKLGMDGILELKHERQNQYESLADIIVNIDHRSPDDIAKEILKQI